MSSIDFRLLIIWSILIFQKENIYKTAIDYAKEKNKDEVVEILSNRLKQLKQE